MVRRARELKYRVLGPSGLVFVGFGHLSPTLGSGCYQPYYAAGAP